MKVSLENLLFRILSIPLKDHIKQNKLVALGSFVALGIFAAGIYYGFRALRNTFSANPAGPARQVDSAAHNALEQDSLAKVVIPAEVRPVLDRLFEGSLYSINALPTYPHALNVAKHENFDRSKMTSGVIQGTTDDGRPFIAIRVSCIVTQEYVDKEQIMDKIMVGKTLSNTIIIGQYRPSGAIPGGGDQNLYGVRSIAGEAISPLSI